ncbi:MAG TPA: transaldolase family protein [Gemmatimonadaceae bacterium]|nr:transaldolase family protein [Gemmatimonadaceae bacterium]
MKIFVQSASVAEIRELASAGLLDGVVLSPVDLATEDPSATLLDRLAEITVDFGVPVCVPVSAISGADIYREARDIARVSEHAIVQIPFVEDAVAPIRKLVEDGVRICATQVYSGAQAFIAAKLGASMVATDVREIDAQGRPSAEMVAQIRAVIDKCRLECDVAVTAPQSSIAFTNYLLAGADVAYVTPELFGSLLVHSLTDRGVDRYLSALSRRHKPRSL